MADEDDKADDPTEDAEGIEGEEGEEGEGKKGGKKKLLMIAVPLLLLIGGGAGAYFTGMLDSLLGVESVEEGEEGEHADGEGEHGDKKGGKGSKECKEDGEEDGEKDGEKDCGGSEAAFLPIPTMIVNLNTEDGTPRFLRLTVQLELEDASEKEDVEAIIPRVIDQFQIYLRELRIRDLRGSAGIYRLQMELLWRVNQATSPIEIKDVLFQEILIQ